MRVFLDTNVLVSAVASRGLCADVMREVLLHHRLIVSDPLLRELRKALRKKVRVPENLIDEMVGLLLQDSDLSTGSSPVNVDIKDKDDLVILSGALSAHADVFVTGDKELLQLKKVGRMPILSPRSFWEKLKAQRHEGL